MAQKKLVQNKGTQLIKVLEKPFREIPFQLVPRKRSDKFGGFVQQRILHIEPIRTDPQRQAFEHYFVMHSSSSLSKNGSSFAVTESFVLIADGIQKILDFSVFAA